MGSWMQHSDEVGMALSVACSKDTLEPFPWEPFLFLFPCLRLQTSSPLAVAVFHFFFSQKKTFFISNRIGS